MTMVPNKINVFQVKPNDVFATYWDLFKQFNKAGILGCEIDIAISDVNGVQYQYQFKHEDSSEILDSNLDSLRVGNLVAIAQEHGKDDVNFGVLFRRSAQESIEIKDNNSKAE